MATVPRGLRGAYKAALAQGWTVTVTGGGHLRWQSPRMDRAPVFTSKSPSDSRAIKNAVSELRRHGLRL